MIKFNKEEISLCKQVAERYRKKVGWGDWGLVDDQIHLYDVITIGKDTVEKGIIPLWTISDCLEFLQEKVGVIELWRHGRNLNKWLYRLNNHRWNDGKTPLEACLRAVLAVLEEKPK